MAEGRCLCDKLKFWNTKVLLIFALSFKTKTCKQSPFAKQNRRRSPESMLQRNVERMVRENSFFRCGIESCSIPGYRELALKLHNTRKNVPQNQTYLEIYSRAQGFKVCMFNNNLALQLSATAEAMGKHTKRGGVKRRVQAHGWIDPAKTRMDQATSPLLAHLAEPKAEEVPKASREASKDATAVRGPDILNEFLD